MKTIKLLLAAFLLILLSACSKQMFETNGETIYKTGRDQSGEKLLARNESRIPLVNSCKNCHGKNGDAMKDISLKYSYLSDPANFSIPYNDSLLFRFLDHDLRSDGVKANIGIIWKMSDQDKKDLVEYLKTL